MLDHPLSRMITVFLKLAAGQSDDFRQRKKPALSRRLFLIETD